MFPTYIPLFYVIKFYGSEEPHYFSNLEECEKYCKSKGLFIRSDEYVYRKDDSLNGVGVGFVDWACEDKDLNADYFNFKLIRFLESKWNIKNLTVSQINKIIKLKGLQRAVYIANAK